MSTTITPLRPWDKGFDYAVENVINRVPSNERTAWWAAQALPILELMGGERRDWAALNRIRRELRMTEMIFKHCLAWLETRGLARAFTKGRKVFWVKINYFKRD